MWAIFAVNASIIAAISSILQKESLKKLHAVQLMTISTTLVIIFSFALMPFFSFTITPIALLYTAVYGFISAAAMIFTVRAMRHMDVSVVAPFFNLGTAFSAILAVIIFKERVTILGVIGIFLLVLGGYLLELRHRNLLQPIKEVIKSESVHYLLSGVFLYSIAYVFAKFALEFVDPVPFFFYQQVFCLLIFVGITFFVYKGVKDIKEGYLKGKFLIPLMAILLIMENIFMFQSLKLGEASLVIPLYRTWTLWAVVFGCQFLHEKNLVKRAFASLLMIAGAALILI